MSTRNLSERIATLEVMVEMLVAHDIMRERDPDQAVADYGEVAAMALSVRRPEDDLSGFMSVLEERLAKVREHLHLVRQAAH